MQKALFQVRLDLKWPCARPIKFWNPERAGPGSVACIYKNQIQYPETDTGAQFMIPGVASSLKPSCCYTQADWRLHGKPQQTGFHPTAIDCRALHIMQAPGIPSPFPTQKRQCSERAAGGAEGKTKYKLDIHLPEVDVCHISSEKVCLFVCGMNQLCATCLAPAMRANLVGKRPSQASSFIVSSWPLERYQHSR